MKQKLMNSIQTRLISEVSHQNPVKFLKNYKVEDYIDTVVSIVYLYTRSKRGSNKNTIYFAELISAIGHGIRGYLKLKRDSGVAAKTGAFILYTFELAGLIKVVLGQGAKGHNSYIIQVVEDDAICDLWSKLEPHKVEKLPSETPYESWKTSKHPTGAQMVKTGNKGVLDVLTLDTHPIVFNCINKAQEIGWKINQDIYNISLWALRNKTDAFAEIWEARNAEAKATKLREAKAISDMAKRFIDKTFYHLYYFDFRGRKYPATAYLHEQGSDFARGLLLRADSKSIGAEGYFWLMVSIASNWAGDAGRLDGAKTDKIPLQARFEWAVDNEEIFLNYAMNPKVDQGWMKADKPWQFLAACNELKKLREWQVQNGGDFHDFNYKSSLECYIDGSNNGSQHLSALTKDEITAPHVNLVPLDLPGDLYKYVADHVWERIKGYVSELDPNVVKECERFIDNLIELKKSIGDAEPKSDKRKHLIEDIQRFKSRNQELLDVSAPVYWNRVIDQKHRRKVVKRLKHGACKIGRIRGTTQRVNPEPSLYENRI